MIAKRRFVVISGLPASGKSTLGKQLASALGLPFFDKDAILEALFDAMGPIDSVLRQQLSRASDRVLATLVEQSSGGVVTSFWRHPGDEGDSGTPSEWLRRLSAPVVEVYCRCNPELAVRRFLCRSRHPGHLDAARSEEGLLTQFRAVDKRGPLGVGRLVVMETTTPRETEPLIREITIAFADDAEP